MSGILGDEVKKEIEKIVFDCLENHNNISEDEIKEITSSLIPELNSAISRQIKVHFVEIASYIIEKFGEM